MSPPTPAPPPSDSTTATLSYPSAENASSLGWLPAIPIVCGLIVLAWLSRSLIPYVHVAGDGALKQYLIAGWADGERISSDIVLPRFEGDVYHLAERHREPFGAPFVYEGKAVFPLHFLILTLPLFKAFGYYGLFILPAFSVLALWLIVWRFLARQGLGGWPAFVALTLLVFSPLTFFGMMFWEHTPGVAALIAAIALAMHEKARPYRCVVAGFFLGLAVAMRPELILPAAVFFAAMLLWDSRRMDFGIGVVLSILAWAAVHQLTTGTPFGIHGKQEFFIHGADWLAQLAGFYAGLLKALLQQYGAEVFAAAAAIVLAVRERQHRRYLATLLAMIAAALLLIPFIAPYSGEYLGFRRFELVVLPLGALLAAPVARRWRWAGPLLLAMCFLRAPTLWNQARDFQWAHGERIMPVYELIDREKPALVICDSNAAIVELSWLLAQGTPMILQKPPIHHGEMLAGLAPRYDLKRVIVVLANPHEPDRFELELTGGVRVAFTRATEGESFFVAYRVERVP